MPRAPLILLLLAASATASAQPTTQPAFLIAVYMQPIESFDTWKSRGVNSLVGYESRGGTVTNAQWTSAATAIGFHYIRQPADDLPADARDPRLLAFMHDDEPDAQNPPTDPKLLAADCASWKKAAPNKPVFINFSGGNILSDSAPKDLYASYILAADWIASDFYPVAGYNRPDWLWKVGAAADRLRDWSGGKPQFCFIETSNQRLPWMPRTTRGVTPDELRALIWHAVIHGARGVIYFPQQLGDKKTIPFRYDATPAKVVAEMVLQNARLADMAPFLASSKNPPPHKITATPPLEIGWRVHAGTLHVIALNFSDDIVKSTVTIDRPRALFNDDFAPYQVRTYKLPLATGR
jgi:hypothetical protein